ncbi:hypothetical protein ES708_12193 [subsurface metagenome]
MSELEGLILFWKAQLAATGYLLEPSTEAHIKNTIKHLEELQRIKES